MRARTRSGVRPLATLVAGAFLLCFSVPADAQETRSETPETEDWAAAPRADEWNYDRLYSVGWRAQALIGVEALGVDGEKVGEVDDLLVDPGGTLLGIVVKGGGILGIGDTSLLVPWSEVRVGERMASVTVPLSDENAPEFKIDEALPLRSSGAVDGGGEPDSVWEATTLIGDTIDVRGVRESYGVVEDLIFSPAGALMAVVVDPEDAIDEGGPYAFPYLENAYDPVYNAYTVPYEPQESARLERFDFSALRNDVFR